VEGIADPHVWWVLTLAQHSLETFQAMMELATTKCRNRSSLNALHSTPFVPVPVISTCGINPADLKLSLRFRCLKATATPMVRSGSAHLRTMTAHRRALCWVVLLCCAFNGFIVQTHYHLTQRVASAAHGGGVAASDSSKPAADGCLLCQIASHGSLPLVGSMPALIAPAASGFEVFVVSSPVLSSAPPHSWQARAPPSISNCA